MTGKEKKSTTAKKKVVEVKAVKTPGAFKGTGVVTLKAPALQVREFEVAKIIKTDETEANLAPVLKGNVCEVFVNNHLTANTRILLNGKNVWTVDFGITVDLPQGYKINGQVNSKFAAVGLVCTHVYLDEKNRLKFIVINSGPQTPVVMIHGDSLGEIWIEPILCNWI